MEMHGLTAEVKVNKYTITQGGAEEMHVFLNG
jgi:hypothetical protein